jgi:light-regulated signal transduction histidine kinase (bacteriophytochrome)
VNSRYGGSRNLSKIIEEVISSYNVVETLQISVKELGVEVTGYPPCSEVEAHGGSIVVESKVGEGSTLTVRILLNAE